MQYTKKDMYSILWRYHKLYIELIVDALNKLGLATEREISDYINLTHCVDRNLIKSILEAEETKFKYYNCEEFFAKKRYTLSFKEDARYPLPYVIYWPINRNELIAKGKCVLNSNKSLIFIIDNTKYKLLVDNERHVIFCISTNRYLDGVIDFKRTPERMIRFPTICRKTFERDGKSEWLWASELHFGSNIQYLRIRGTDI